MSKGKATDLVQPAHSDFPVLIAAMTPSAEERRLALFLCLLLIGAFLLIAPFAATPLPRMNVFVPVVQTVLFFSELITAILLFAQYSIRPQLGLLAVACGYVFSGLFAFLQTLAFPGAYGPAGLFGDPLSTAPYLFFLWHIAFPLAAIVYALSDDTSGGFVLRRSAKATIGVAVASVLVVIAVLTWAVTGAVSYLPSLFIDATKQAPITNYISGAIWLLSIAALLMLFLYKNTSLSVWLMVALVATLPDLALSTVMTTVRFTFGWYTARAYALIASFIVLAALLTDATVLYARLANAVLLLRRERSNRLMSLSAATAAVAHEIRQPLTAIVATSQAASILTERNPPDVGQLRACLAEISESAFRLNEIVTGVRGLFDEKTDRPTISVGALTQEVLHSLEHELLLNDVAVETSIQNDLPEIVADRTQIQQVLVNLARNAIDAMNSSNIPRAKRLRVGATVKDRSIVLTLQDSGPGIDPSNSGRIFEPFFTTKANGIGLGLPICRRILETHNGRLRLAKSDSDGCIFEITLPIAAMHRDSSGNLS
jgi:signal transduction histidine kinase